MNETQHVRMCDAHHAHVCTASNTTLLHDISHLVDDVHEGNWARSNTGCGAHHRAVRPQKFISHACAATGLVNRGCCLGVLHDAVEGIGHVKNKTGGELSICFTRVDQTGRVGNEFARQHHFAHGGEELVAF